MTRPNPFWIASLLLLGLGPFESTATEYEQAVEGIAGVGDGGCQLVGLPTPEQEQERDRYYSTYGWPIITTAAADAAARFIGTDGAIDYGAGAGYFAHLLADRGVNVAAVDDWSWGKPKRLWHPVSQGSFEVLPSYRSRALVLSWPTRETGMATKALREWGGDRLVYVGEILRGAGEPSFFFSLAEDWEMVGRISIPNWYNRNDDVWLFQRGKGMGWKAMTRLAYEGCKP